MALILLMAAINTNKKLQWTLEEYYINVQTLQDVRCFSQVLFVLPFGLIPHLAVQHKTSKT